MTLSQPSYSLRKLFIAQDTHLRYIYDLSLIEYSYILCVTVMPHNRHGVLDQLILF